MSEIMTTEMDQYLTFTLDEEVFALNITSVREVLEMTGITKVPHTPEFMRGVINLRGQAVPVADLRLKFGMSRTTATVDTCIIIVELYLDGEPLVMGALADSVREVIELAPGDVEPPPRMGTRIDSDFISGMGRSEEGFLILLDISRVFSAEELGEPGSMAGSAAEPEAA